MVHPLFFFAGVPAPAQRPRRLPARWVLLVALMVGTVGRAEETATEEPRFQWDWTAGFLTEVGGGATPLDYDATPLILSLKLPPHFTREWRGGLLIFRPRLDLLLEPIVRGPESFFGGVTAAGELEWRAPSRRFSAFFSSGGGVGWLDSKGHEVAGGQGQDFNFTWFIHAGLRFDVRRDWFLSPGVYFQHISNRNLDDINPGVNLLGPTLSFGRRF